MEYSSFGASWIYHQLIILALDNQAIDEAQAYFQQFSQYKESNNLHSIWINEWYLISEALPLMISTRIKDKAKA
ncbi:MAG: hypothetical protein ACFFB3_08590 [Candidatus Hodarchaeota archaeon]